MSEIKELGQSEIGTPVEKLVPGQSEIGKSVENNETLTEEELNKPIDGLAGPEMASLDCRSECKYNTGETSKYSNYGFSG